MRQRINKLNKIQKTKSIDAFLITSAASVKYFSGYFYYFGTGNSPFHLIPAALFIVPGKSSAIVIADNELGQVSSLDPVFSVKPYTSYIYEKPLEFTKHFLSRINEMIRQSKLEDTSIGIEQNTLPHVISQSLITAFPGIKFTDVSPDLASLRMVKDPDEIEQITKAANLCDIGQVAVLKHARVGMRELELFSLVRSEMEAAAGARLPLMVDLVSGKNTASAGGLPTNKRIENGDLILSDITPCLNGYWGDSCNTMAVSKPSPAQKKTFHLVKEALDIGINAIRPGVKACEIDRLMRQHIGNYPHHSGHGIGTMYHEEPRIVSYNKTELTPDMVIALEPGIYVKNYGIRLEHIVLVTEKGCEKLTKFEHCFEQFI